MSAMSLPARIALVLVVLLVLVASGWRIHVKADAAGHARAMGEVARQALAQAGAARQRELEAAKTIEEVTQGAAREKTDLQRRVRALADSLRERPERTAGPGAMPPGAADPVACTGAGLYRPDAAFLVGEAARADQLRIDLRACQAAYDAAVSLTAD